MYRRRPPQPRLAPSLEAQLYEGFLAGMSCEDVSAQNPGISVGQVVATRIDCQWDERRRRYLEDLLLRAGARVQQVQLEAMEFLRLRLACTHKAYTKQAKKYLQTGATRDMPERLLNWREYKDTMELMLKLVGKDAQGPTQQHLPSAPPANVEVRVSVEPPASGAVTPRLASEYLQKLEAERK